jgi:hypothetical protein
MGWTSNIPAVVRRLDAADRAGLVAMQGIVQNEVKKGLRGGYTSGNFVTGQSVNSVTRSEPERTATGHTGKVGTNLLYNLFWELGHRNIFTRRFERVEVWVPALYNTRAQQIDAYQRVVSRMLGGQVTATEASSGDQ